jgi:hypothetical protein
MTAKVSVNYSHTYIPYKNTFIFPQKMFKDQAQTYIDRSKHMNYGNCLLTSIFFKYILHVVNYVAEHIA